RTGFSNQSRVSGLPKARRYATIRWRLTATPFFHCKAHSDMKSRRLYLLGSIRYSSKAPVTFCICKRGLLPLSVERELALTADGRSVRQVESTRFSPLLRCSAARNWTLLSLVI